MLTKLLNQNKLSLLFRTTGHLRTFASGSRSRITATDNVEELIKTPLSRPTKSKEEIENEAYVKYSKSKASNFKTSESYRDFEAGGPPSQWYFVTYSTMIFLLYFCVLREENDMDENLYEPFSGNEKIYSEILKVQLKNNQSSNSIEEIKAKIKELEEKISKKED